MSNYLPIQLPSRCLTYPDIKPEDILVRPYNGGDEIILAQINPANLERNFAVILKDVIQGIDPLKLTTGDRLYLIIWEYVNSYSEILHVNQRCSHCLKTGFNINLKTDLQIAYLPDDYTEPCSITLPGSKENVQLRVFTVEDEIEIEKMAAKGTDPHHYRYARSIVGCDEPFAQMERLKKWKVIDTARLRKFHDIDTFHGPKSEVHVLCPHCGEEEEVSVPFRFDFFYPTSETLGRCFGEGVSTL